MKKREFENSNPDPDIDILTLDAILKLYKSKMTEPELKDFETAEKIIKELWRK